MLNSAKNENTEQKEQDIKEIELFWFFFGHQSPLSPRIKDAENKEQPRNIRNFYEGSTQPKQQNRSNAPKESFAQNS